MYIKLTGEMFLGESTRTYGQTYETIDRDAQTENSHVRKPILATKTTTSER
jgi:hypothetical protein